MNLRERVNELGNNLPLMTGREKGDLKTIENKIVTIDQFGFLKDEKDMGYVVFTVKEVIGEFFFGGSVLTEDLIELEQEGYREEIEKDGLPILLTRKMSKNKREYTAVTYYPASN